MESLLRSLLLSLNPEKAHICAMNLLKIYSSYSPQFLLKTSKIEFEAMGLQFPNRVGLAAGFDKNAECLYAWQKLGFGFAEVGTVTALPQSGNPKPRIFRVKEKEALWNRMGFNNDGCVQIAQRIAKQRKQHRLTIPIGINIGKSKVTPLDKASKDYQTSFLHLADLADYIVVNISSPNTPGLRHLQETEMLKPLLNVLCNENSKRTHKVPLLIKLSPDLNLHDLKDIVDVVLQFDIQGLIVSNTTTDKTLIDEDFGSGGLSGRPLFEKSTDCLKHVRSYVGSKLLLIASGGVMSAEQARAKFACGADLVQIYTGFVYHGPRLIREIAQK